ncbi:MAG: hypothetical protein WKF84_14680 [Pyrinomonadaceae bacterium]
MVSTQHIGTALPEIFGFHNGKRGVLTSRTMMLDDLSMLLAYGPSAVRKQEFWAAIVDRNALGKKAYSTRKKSAARLIELYGLDQSVTLFRVLQILWRIDPLGQPLLAILCACARDPLLRITAKPVLQARQGEEITKEQLEDAVRSNTEDRFNPATLNQVARNAASSWTQSGHLVGRNIKKRSKPQVTVTNVTYALLLGYLCGMRGQSLFQSFWISLLDAQEHVLQQMAREASLRGWLTYRGIGDAVEVSFYGMLTSREREVLSEQN